MGGVFAVVVLVTGLLAHARLTRLATTDAITAPLRAAIVDRFGASSRPAYLAHCRWCTGLWLAAPVALAALALAGLPLLLAVLLAPAYSHATALLAQLETED